LLGGAPLVPEATAPLPGSLLSLALLTEAIVPLLF
jgi:hypothetical protein